ncbi:hypothetical protein F5Y08DRAFT_312272 [Xylaria arbuscula]|nr:hypothetical protein F5Y08DRAFT_312272 [Xylaria arbuscula]
MASPSRPMRAATQDAVSIELSRLPPQPMQAPDCATPRNLDTAGEETGRAPQPVGALIPSKGPSNIFRKIVKICSILGIILALILGVAQWIAQDKSTTIAKESELVTLALSCSDEEIKNTSICQHFLDKYPDGPVISRRGNFPLGDYETMHFMQGDLHQIAVQLALMDQFLQRQNNHFLLALSESDPNQSLALLEDIVEAGKGFRPNMTLHEASSTLRRIGEANHTLAEPISMADQFMLGFMISFLIVL